ncbi:11641_t:CDS:1, partial [Scutellospora calospora]
EVSAKTIKNCWLHTKIISLRDNDRTPIIPISSTFVDNNEAVNEYLSVDPNDANDLQQVIDTLCIRHPMSLEDLLRAEEHEVLHQQFNEKDFVQAATEIEQVEDKVVTPSLTGKEQLNILRSALKIVDKRIDNGRVTMKFLCKLQSCICEEIRKEEAEIQI